MRLIDADKLKVNLFIMFGNHLPNGLLDEIDNSPTVDTGDAKYLEERDADAFESGYIVGLGEQRPQGEWILKETDCDDGGNNRYECTNCHYTDIHSDSAEVNFCWHCGAEMQKEKTHETN